MTKIEIKKNLSVSLSNTMLQELRRVAEKKRITVSDLIRTLIQREIDQANNDACVIEK